MSKFIKQLEMTALKHTFGDVRDLVVLKVQGLSSDGDYNLRALLRKKKIPCWLSRTACAGGSSTRWA